MPFEFRFLFHKENVMEKYQYQCIKAATDEVAALESDGYRIRERSVVQGETWWMRYLKHPNGNSALVEMSPNRGELMVWINGKRKKWLKFGV